MMNNVKRLIFTAAALIALSGFAFSADYGSSSSQSGSATGGTTGNSEISGGSDMSSDTEKKQKKSKKTKKSSKKSKEKTETMEGTTGSGTGGTSGTTGSESTDGMGMGGSSTGGQRGFLLPRNDQRRQARNISFFHASCRLKAYISQKERTIRL